MSWRRVEEAVSLYLLTGLVLDFRSVRWFSVVRTDWFGKCSARGQSHRWSPVRTGRVKSGHDLSNFERGSTILPVTGEVARDRCEKFVKLLLVQPSITTLRPVEQLRVCSGLHDGPLVKDDNPIG